MQLKILKSLGAASRRVVLVDKRHLWKGKAYKELTEKITKTGGRNNVGIKTVSGIGGGSKKIYRKIDFLRNKEGVATVERLEYDPNRTGFIALIKYEDGERAYIMAPESLKEGDRVSSGKVDILPGNCLKLKDIPVGTYLHNVEIVAGKGAKIARSAGAKVSLTGKETGFAILTLTSGEIRKISLECKATVGTVSNAALFNEKLGKAGRTRHRGKTSKVRGVVKNPVDHHNGGRARGGKVFGNKNGNMRKGQRTRKKKKSDKMILRRRK